MGEVKNPCWKFWKLPVEPLMDCDELSGIAVLNIKAFRVKYDLNEESEKWIQAKISRNDFLKLRKMIEKKISINKSLIDIAKCFLYVLLCLSVFCSIYFFYKRNINIGILFTFAGLVSIVFIRILGILFIKLLKGIELSMAAILNELNQWLFNSDRQIFIGSKCFWIKIEAGMDGPSFENYRNGSIEEWLKRRRSSVT
jgi:hypothetical protein